MCHLSLATLKCVFSPMTSEFSEGGQTLYQIIVFGIWLIFFFLATSHQLDEELSVQYSKQELLQVSEK